MAIDSTDSPKTAESEAPGEPLEGASSQQAVRTNPTGTDEPAAQTDVDAAKNALEAALAKADAEVQDLKNKWLRAAADLDNFRKRANRDREDAVKFGNERLLLDLLPVLDDLDRTVEATQTATDIARLAEGVRLVQRKFLVQLQRHGVEAFESVGKAFDPTMHEAVQQVHTEATPAGAVVQEVRRGFMLNGRLLRPAMVVVSLGLEQQSKVIE